MSFTVTCSSSGWVLRCGGSGLAPEALNGCARSHECEKHRLCNGHRTRVVPALDSESSQRVTATLWELDNEARQNPRMFPSFINQTLGCCAVLGQIFGLDFAEGTA
jgi:hypothetical protein